MSALQVVQRSDILAATGKAGMHWLAGTRFWSLRRILLAAGYALVFLAGLAIFLAGDFSGLVLILAAVTGVVFIHRTWLGVGVWIYVLVAGLVALWSGDDMGAYGLVAGLAFGTLALPWPRRQPVVRAAYYQQWQPSPFAMPSTGPQAVVQPATSPAEPEATAPADPVAAVPAIRLIGRIQIITDAGDVTAGVIGKPVVGFLWLYLLARYLRRPDDRATRTALTDEVAHAVSDPRGRLRGYLRDLARLPEPLGAMVKVDDEMVGFDLDGFSSDVGALRQLAARVNPPNGIDDADLNEAQALLALLGDGEFLPGFEEMDKRVTRGRGVAGQVVDEVRTQVDSMRADIAVVTAQGLLDRGRPAAAAALLEPLLIRSEDRDDVARILSNALHELGQHERASAVRRRNAVGQES